MNINEFSVTALLAVAWILFTSLPGCQESSVAGGKKLARVYLSLLAIGPILYLFGGMR